MAAMGEVDHESVDSCRIGEVESVGTVELVCVGRLLRICCDLFLMTFSFIYLFIYLFTLYLPLAVYKNSRLKSTIKLYGSTNN